MKEGQVEAKIDTKVNEPIKKEIKAVIVLKKQNDDQVLPMKVKRSSSGKNSLSKMLLKADCNDALLKPALKPASASKSVLHSKVPTPSLKVTFND